MEFYGFEIFSADAIDETNIFHDKICPLILSGQFQLCPLVRKGPKNGFFGSTFPGPGISFPCGKLSEKRERAFLTNREPGRSFSSTYPVF